MQAVVKSRIPNRQMRHRVMRVLVLCHFAVCILFSQELFRKQQHDSLLIKNPINQSLLRNFKLNIVLSPAMYGSTQYFPGFLNQSLMKLPSSLSWQFQQQVDVISPWKQELAEQKKLRTLSLILQAVTADGTAYLLYEHIDKYGFK